MATGYSLLLGILLIALCSAMGTGDRAVDAVSVAKRAQIIQIASAELGVREATANNDGVRVEEYLHYTNLGKGQQWCAAFVSWCYG